MNRFLLILLIMAVAGDLLTTAHGLNRGCVEAIWPTQSIYIMAVAKVFAIFCNYHVGSTYPRVANAVAILGIIAGAFGTVHNLGVHCGG